MKYLNALTKNSEGDIVPCIYEYSPHSIIREEVVWTRHLSVEGTPLLKVEHILIKDLSKEHLEKLTTFVFGNAFDEVFSNELNWRKNNV